MLSCPTCQRSVEDGARACPFDGTDLSGAIGKLLGERYRVLSRLGAGAMGDVYLAEHVLLRKKMAVKVLKTELCRSEDLVRRFQQEAVAASRIGQENIVSITDFGRTDDGSLYLVMEALAGQNLNALIEAHQPLPVERAVPILIQLSRALGAAHAQGIVHRDLKADNVMVVPRDDGSDLVKVLDFGISKMSGQEGGQRATQVGTVIGTPAYMAPEQARGDVIDHRADIYSFGVLAYELVTGGVPFEASTLTGVLMKHLSEPPVPPSIRAPNVPIPPRLEALILRALEKDPARRPQSMEAIREELIRIAQELGVLPRFTPAPIPAVSAPAFTPIRATPPPGVPPELAATYLGSARSSPSPIPDAPANQTAAYGAKPAVAGLARTNGAPRPGPSSPAFEEALAATFIPNAQQSPIARLSEPILLTRRRRSRKGGLVAVLVLALLAALVVLRGEWAPLLPPPWPDRVAQLEQRIRFALGARPPPPARPPAHPLASHTAPAPTPPPKTAVAPTQPPAHSTLATQPQPTATAPVTPGKPDTHVEPATQKVSSQPAVEHAVVKAKRYLTDGDIKRAFRRSGPKFRHCLEAYSKLLPAPKGQLLLTFTVATSGDVTTAQLATPGLGGTPLEECVLTAIKEVKFPLHAGADDTYDLPLVYGVNH